MFNEMKSSETLNKEVEIPGIGNMEWQSSYFNHATWAEMMEGHLVPRYNKGVLVEFPPETVKAMAHNRYQIEQGLLPVEIKISLATPFQVAEVGQPDYEMHWIDSNYSYRWNLEGHNGEDRFGNVPIMERLEKALPDLGVDCRIVGEAEGGLISALELLFDVKGDINDPAQYLHDLAARLAD